jgi:hypothetical protein
MTMANGNNQINDDDSSSETSRSLFAYDALGQCNFSKKESTISMLISLIIPGLGLVLKHRTAMGFLILLAEIIIITMIYFWYLYDFFLWWAGFIGFIVIHIYQACLTYYK